MSASPCAKIFLRHPTWTLEKLYTKYSVNAYRSLRYPQLVALRHTSLAPMECKLVQECEGLILDEDNDWDVVARPPDVFFAADSVNAHKLDWASVVAEEFLDGLQYTLYWFDDDWRVATQRSPDAADTILGKLSAEKLFWKTFELEGFQKPSVSLKQVSWTFQLTGPAIPSVTENTRHHLTLVSIRHKSGYEIELSGQDFFPYPVAVPMESADEAKDLLKSMKPTHCAGFILKDKFFNRVKLLHPEYNTLRRDLSRYSLQKLTRLVMLQGAEEWCKLLPEFGGVMEKLSESLKRMSAEIEAVYWLIKDIETDKLFAQRVQGLPYAGILFSMRKGYISNATAGLRLMPINKLIALLQIDEHALYGLDKPPEKKEKRELDACALVETQLRPELKDAVEDVVSAQELNDALGG